MPQSVQAALYFLTRDELFLTEKPYAFRFPINNEALAQTNMKMERKDGIHIHDIRGTEKTFSFHNHGFEVVSHHTTLRYEDFYQPQKVSIYLKELEVILQNHLQAVHVEVFRYGLRKRDSSFPVSTGENYEFDQPTSVAHIDTTPKEAAEEFKRQHGERSELLLGKRVHIWKPLKGPLNDWPLALCDASDVDSSSDLEAADLLYPELATENYQVYYKPSYTWRYLSDHQPSELIIFKQSDSDSKSICGVPHCSFFNSLTPLGEEPRESIEARALVYYDE